MNRTCKHFLQVSAVFAVTFVLQAAHILADDKPPGTDTAPIASNWLDVVAGCNGTDPCEVMVPVGAYALDAPVMLKSRTTLRLAPGTLISATGWNGDHDCLFAADNVTGVRILGAPGARLDMAGVEKSEHRHAIRWRGCRDCELSDLVIYDPAGDGIYIGPTWDTARTPSSGVVRRVSVARPYRSGVSVVATDELLIEDLHVHGRTPGKSMSPHVALNFEPAHPKDPITATVRRAWLQDGPSRQLGVLLQRSLADSVRRISVTDAYLVGGAWGISISCPAGTGTVDVTGVTILSPKSASISFADSSQIQYTIDGYLDGPQLVQQPAPTNLTITRRP